MTPAQRVTDRQHRHLFSAQDSRTVSWPMTVGGTAAVPALMGLRAIYRQPRTSQPAAGRWVYPYLLRDLTITRANQVWAADITYLPMARGFLYLVAIMDWQAGTWWLGGCHSGTGFWEALTEVTYSTPTREARRTQILQDHGEDQHGWQGQVPGQQLVEPIGGTRRSTRPTNGLEARNGLHFRFTTTGEALGYTPAEVFHGEP